MAQVGRRTRAREPEPSSTSDPRFTGWEDYRDRSTRPTGDFMEIVLGLRCHDLPVEKRKGFG